MCKKGEIKEVNDVRDETDKQGLKIAIDYKRGTDPDILMRKLFKMTKLQDTYSCNMKRTHRWDSKGSWSSSDY